MRKIIAIECEMAYVQGESEHRHALAEADILPAVEKRVWEILSRDPEVRESARERKMITMAVRGRMQTEIAFALDDALEAYHRTMMKKPVRRTFHERVLRWIRIVTGAMAKRS